jgi:hypothetical protein
MTDLVKQLEDKKKGCGKTFNNLICGESYDSSYKPTRFLYCPTCQAKIEYLKKGISACEEILNSQESLNGNKANTSPTAPKNVEELSEVGCDRKSLSAPDTQTLIKQALSQRNQEILEIIERMMNKKEDETDVQIWGEELKQQINKEGGMANRKDPLNELFLSEKETKVINSVKNRFKELTKDKDKEMIRLKSKLKKEQKKRLNQQKIFDLKINQIEMKMKRLEQQLTTKKEDGE